MGWFKGSNWVKSSELGNQKCIYSAIRSVIKGKEAIFQFVVDHCLIKF